MAHPTQQSYCMTKAIKTLDSVPLSGSIADSDLHGLSSLATQFYTLWGSSLYSGKTFGELFQATFNSPNLKTSQEGIQQLYIGDPALYTLHFPD